MGYISPSTFNKIKHYVGVRLQQGVPLVDADWNEQEDIRKYELQAFLKWFVGNGVPEGNDGFHILANSPPDNDFSIKGGDGTIEKAGRCLVDGWDAMINEERLKYTDQELYNDNEKADTWGVAHLDPLPEGALTGLVYLDVWERRVDWNENPDLLNPAIGIETCIRLKREWVVRIEVLTLPALPSLPAIPVLPSLPACPEGHVFYPLAYITRPAGETAILQEHIKDLRQTGLRTISYPDFVQIRRDAFGETYALDQDGEPNLKVSLRRAINAILRGELPTSPDIQITIETTRDLNPFALKDLNGDIWLFWQSNRSGQDNIWCKHKQPDEEWETLVDEQVTVTTDSADDANPNALLDNNGNLWVFWQSNRSGNWDIWCKHRQPDGDWEDDEQVTTDPDLDREPNALLDNNGNIWVFWQSRRSGRWGIWCNHKQPGGNWEAGNEEQVSVSMPPTLGIDNNFPNALSDNNGDIWVFWQSNRNGGWEIWCNHKQPGGNWAEQNEELVSRGDSAGNYPPSAIKDMNGDIWVFWRSEDKSGNSDIWYNRYRQAVGTWEVNDTHLTTDPAGDFDPIAVLDSNGDIWVFWRSEDKSGNSDIWYNRYNHTNGKWHGDMQLTEDPALDFNPFPIEDVNGDVCVFWISKRRGNYDIWLKKIISSI